MILILSVAVVLFPCPLTRSLLWGAMHDHPVIEFDHCLRKHKRS